MHAPEIDEVDTMGDIGDMEVAIPSNATARTHYVHHMHGATSSAPREFKAGPTLTTMRMLASLVCGAIVVGASIVVVTGNLMLSAHNTIGSVLVDPETTATPRNARRAREEALERTSYSASEQVILRKASLKSHSKDIDDVARVVSILAKRALFDGGTSGRTENGEEHHVPLRPNNNMSR